MNLKIIEIFLYLLHINLFLFVIEFSFNYRGLHLCSSCSVTYII